MTELPEDDLSARDDRPTPIERRHLVVDGEEWDVVVQPDGGCDFEWLSGANPGYGFPSGRGVLGTVGEKGDAAEHRPEPPDLEAQVRSFLAEINPATGHLD